MRLNKFLAKANVASRRKADILIQDGRVTVNGKTVTELGTRVNETHDKIALDGRIVKIAEELVYLMLHKPVSYLVTSEDKFGRPTVFELIGNFNRMVMPVGRLDLNSSGLLLLTNDGELAFRLTHPRFKIDKTYSVRCNGNVDDGMINRLESGIMLDSGRTAPARVSVLQRNDDCSDLEFVVHEGKKRQIRLMCRAIGHSVVSLKRTAFGALRLGTLKEGEFRNLTEGEIRDLRRAVKL